MQLDEINTRRQAAESDAAWRDGVEAACCNAITSAALPPPPSTTRKLRAVASAVGVPLCTMTFT